ncbi:protein kinase domain-containing protein [Ditylenchus destructor]|uniref:Serine/threonine-protein kinase greatwall n=1 Tax=Ditylenchus destructor TaxID=166010 RepID=A0AAD4MZC5_9BILA|nr:protein kinase domain-containing protein [Ditylenchus destructor]
MIHKRISTVFAVLCMYCYIETQSMDTATSMSSENWQNGDWTDDPIFNAGSRAKRNNTASNLHGSIDSLPNPKPEETSKHIQSTISACNAIGDGELPQKTDPQKVTFDTEIMVFERLSQPDVKRAFIVTAKKCYIPSNDTRFHLVMEAIPLREHLAGIPGISGLPANHPVTLAAFLNHYGRLTERLAMLIIVQIITAVNDLHQEGILWGDVTCDNFVFMENWRLKAMNFGKAKLCHDKSNCKSSEPKDGMGCNWDYAAPEVISVTDSMPYGFESDWWSVGIILYKILYGKLPFGDDPRSNVAKYAKKHPEYEIPFPTDHINVTGNGVSVVKGFLNRDPTKRVGSMAKYKQMHAGHTDPHHNHSDPLYVSAGKEIMEKEHWFNATGLDQLKAHEIIDLATKNRDLTEFVTDQLNVSSAKVMYEDARHKMGKNTEEQPQQIPKERTLNRKPKISNFSEHIGDAKQTI